MRTLKATIDEQGNVDLLEPLTLETERRALVTIIEDVPEKSLISFLDELESSPKSQRDAKTIEEAIQRERDAWE